MATIEGSKLREAKCPFCDYSTKRLTSFEKHLVASHNTSAQEVWNLNNAGPVLCACGCGQATSWKGWWNGYTKIIKGHSVSLEILHGKDKADAIKREKNEKLKGKTNWAKGLTKESDERVAKRAIATSEGRKEAFEKGQIEIWSKGLTKESDATLKHMSEDRRQKIASGQIEIWSKGLTKETDERVATMSSAVSLSLQQADLRQRLDAQKRLSEEEIRRRIEISGTLTVIAGLEDYTSDKHKVISVACKSCGEQFISSLRTLQWGKCIKCSPGGSRAQEDIAKFVESVIGREIIRNDRSALSPYELDIYDPITATAVEYNGLYWHCILNKSKNYHQFKSKEAVKKNIKLIHVYEDEWRDKRPIVESMIRQRFNAIQRKINARSCVIREVNTQIRKQFFENNHIDGDSRASVAFGLFFNDELIQCMSLRDPIHKEPGTIEICRSASLINSVVRGGVSKLIAKSKEYAKEQGYNNMISYVDTRFGGTGQCYKNAGMTLDKETVPRFWWTDNENRYDRFKIRADAKNNITEKMAAESAGVVKIWGCSNLLYTLNLD